jgi:hypothetical protein
MCRIQVSQQVWFAYGTTYAVGNGALGFRIREEIAGGRGKAPEVYQRMSARQALF